MGVNNERQDIHFQSYVVPEKTKMGVKTNGQKGLIRNSVLITVPKATLICGANADISTPATDNSLMRQAGRDHKLPSIQARKKGNALTQ